MYKRLADTASAALSEPRIVQLSSNLYAVCMEVMKIIPAKYIINTAWQSGLINQNSLIIESSSGNFALGLAVVCREFGLKLHIVGDPAIDVGLQRMLQNLSAQVDILEKPDGKSTYQHLRLNRIKELLEQNRNCYWTRQYDNPLNPEAYRGLASLLVEEIGCPINLVASVGTGGSSVGIGKGLRIHSDDVRLFGVDTFNSILFGLPDGSRNIRGLGNSVMPQNLDHTEFNAIHWVDGGQAYRAALELHARYSLFCGPTGGAAFMVARYLSELYPRRKTIFIAPDTGYRYQNTILDLNGLKAAHLYAESFLSEPTRVSRLDQVGTAGEWACMEWERRSIHDVRSASRSQVAGAML